MIASGRSFEQLLRIHTPVFKVVKTRTSPEEMLSRQTLPTKNDIPVNYISDVESSCSTQFDQDKDSSLHMSLINR